MHPCQNVAQVSINSYIQQQKERRRPPTGFFIGGMRLGVDETTDVQES